jgi:aminocarboxymuconate-semialdehyde decarboxylase
MNPPSAFVPEMAEAVAMAQTTNDFYGLLHRKFPGQFWAFASLPMLHEREALDELGRAIDDLGLAGVGLGGSIGGRPLDDPRFANVLAEINRRRLPVLVHPMAAPADPGYRDFATDVVLGFVYDTSLGVLRFIMSGARDRFPDFPIVVTHFGGTLLFLMARLDDQGVWGTYIPPGREGYQGPRPARAPSEYLKTMFFDSVSHHPPAMRLAAESVGTDRLVMGSDYPWVPDALPRAVDFVERSELTEVQKQGILGFNAQGLFAGQWPDEVRGRETTIPSANG